MCFARFTVPRIGIGQGGFAFADGFPFRSQLCVDADEVELVAWHILLGKDGTGWTLGHAHGAVDALIGVDGQEVGAFAEAVHRADIDAIGVFALDAVFSNNVSHILSVGSNQ